MSSSSGSNRENELKEGEEESFNGFTLIGVSDNPKRWDIEVEGAPETLYANDTYQLEVEFPDDYPTEAPKVIFTDPVPDHPQVYNNGHICLDDLYDNWTSSMTVTDICVSILSMLSRATSKEKPKDNEKCKHGQSN